jgi:membrane-associated phospholipid phosphatase
MKGILITLLSASSVFAQTPTLHKRDAVSISIGAAALLSSFLIRPHVSCPCSPADVNRFDQFSIGKHSKSSDIASYVLIGVAPALGMWKSQDRIRSAVNMGESALLNAGALTLVKNSVGRPRPFVYGTADPSVYMNRSNYVSFYSGHASTAFSLAASVSRDQLPRWAKAVSFSSAAGVGFLRLEAGQHFPTDVLTGSAAGAIFGSIPKQ